MAEMISRAGEFTRAHPGRSMPMRNAAFFCVAMTREVYDRVADMDEDFGIGSFGDDDYCRRVAEAGFGDCLRRTCIYPPPPVSGLCEVGLGTQACTFRPQQGHIRGQLG